MEREEEEEGVVGEKEEQGGGAAAWATDPEVLLATDAMEEGPTLAPSSVRS